MASPFNGRWSLVAAENGVAFYNAIGSPEEYKDKLRKLGEAVKQDPNCYVEELNVSGNTLSKQTWIHGEKRKDSGEQPLNTEVDAKTGDGRPAKVKIVLESPNKLVRTDVGDGFTITYTYVVSGDELTVTLSNGSVTAVDKFKRTS